MSPSVQFSTVNEGDWIDVARLPTRHGGLQARCGSGGTRSAGNAGHTAATLPDGTKAESGGSHGDFRLGGGAVGADDPYFTQHAWLPMDGSIPGGFGGSGAAAVVARLGHPTTRYSWHWPAAVVSGGGGSAGGGSLGGR